MTTRHDHEGCMCLLRGTVLPPSPTRTPSKDARWPGPQKPHRRSPHGPRRGRRHGTGVRLAAGRCQTGPGVGALRVEMERPLETLPRLGAIPQLQVRPPQAVPGVLPAGLPGATRNPGWAPTNRREAPFNGGAGVQPP